ncbi:MAG: hypothetical protein AAGC60_03150 [Acidobacteriota bacterium]
MRRLNLGSMAMVALAALALCIGLSVTATESPELKTNLTMVDELKSPGLEAEISGIFPHPDRDDLYFALANQKPPYRQGQKPMLAEQYRGNLLTVDRDGKIVDAVKLADDDFGGMAMAEGHLFVALTDAAEILKVAPATGDVVARFPLSSPAGGLAYDADRGALLAQLYVGHPHLAVVDPKDGTVLETLWSDESAMGLAKVDGDWLCTWASGWEPGSFSELRVLDQATGKVRARVNLDVVHSSLAPTRTAEGEGFMSLVTVDSVSGETAIRKYSYVGTAL